jgi:hypothetical protein
LLAFAVAPVTASAAASDASRHHEIEARLDVPAHRIAVTDRVAVEGTEVRFLLNRDLAIHSATIAGESATWTETAGWDPRHFWTRIGVAFENSDGSLNLVLNFIPTDPETTIQIREPRPRED